MRIVQLHAENFKRLGVVEIDPGGNVVTVGGENGSGKSSVLDAIFVALKGRAVAPPKPIRAGAEKCVIRLDMGDLVVTRTFHQKDGLDYTDGIKLEDTEGRRYGKPQEVLDGLLGEVGFDPFEFLKLRPKDQAARLLEMVPLSIDLDEFATADKEDFAARRDVNRDVARLEAQVAAIPAEDVPEGAPDRAALTDALANAADTNAGIGREQQRRDDLGGNLDATRNQAEMARQSADRLRREAEEQDALAKQRDAEADKIAAEIEALEPLAERVDTEALRRQLSEADEVLARIDRQNRRAALERELEAAEAKSKGYTDAMAKRAAARNAALAEAEMPVEGLAFAVDDDGDAYLTFEGLPFDKDQISTAAALRVSTAIGMASNPRLRVLRIKDGSLLDKASMKALTEQVEAEDFQLWVEVVGDGGAGIVMEDGLVRGAATDQGDEQQPKAKAKGKKAKAPADAEQGSLV